MDARDPARVELESRIAFLDRTVETLNEVVVEQAHQLEALTRRLARLEERLESATRGPDDEGADDVDPLLRDRPPHY